MKIFIEASSSNIDKLNVIIKANANLFEIHSLFLSSIEIIPNILKKESEDQFRGNKLSATALLLTVALQIPPAIESTGHIISNHDIGHKVECVIKEIKVIAGDLLSTITALKE